jgi:hypothetical protein
MPEAFSNSAICQSASSPEDLPHFICLLAPVYVGPKGRINGNIGRVPDNARISGTDSGDQADRFFTFQAIRPIWLLSTARKLELRISLGIGSRQIGTGTGDTGRVKIVFLILKVSGTSSDQLIHPIFPSVNG